MRIYNAFRSHNSIRRPLTALFSIAALLTTTLAAGVDGQPAQKEVRLTEDQRILHVLNRLGFGARPGDVERVKKMGIESYIALQLEPTRIPDAVAEEKLRDLRTLKMTTAELYEKYPQPGQLLRQLQRQGELPADLSGARQNQSNGRNSEMSPPQNSPIQNEEMSGNRVPNSNPQPRNNEEYRRLLREYYRKHGLQQPQRITAELQASRILRAAYSERQLQEVMVDFWTNHFNVFAGKGADRWLLTAYDRDTVRPHTMGKFYDLLLATAQSPAMLFYLDNFQSVSPNAPSAQRPGQQRRGQRDGLFGLLMGGRRNRQLERQSSDRSPGEMQLAREAAQRQRRGINENYARELMELHTLGVDGGYTQKDVQEVARCFTGWTIFAPRGGGAAAQTIMDGPRAERLRENAGRFYFNTRTHDDGEKIVLGHKISAGGGIKDGLKVLEILSRHPSTAKFIATKLAQHFVSDTPPPALVTRAANAFSKSDGDIRETLKVIFQSPEFYSPESYRAKIKRPFELAISALRSLGAETNGGPQLHQWIARMGEPLYMYQTPNGYSDKAEGWVNTGGLLERLNFGLALAGNRIAGTTVDLKRFAGDASTGTQTDHAELMDRFLAVIVGGDISSKTRQTLVEQIDEQGTNQASQVVGLILGSPEFQQQ